jgi:hypothetical protein
MVGHFAAAPVVEIARRLAVAGCGIGSVNDETGPVVSAIEWSRRKTTFPPTTVNSTFVSRICSYNLTNGVGWNMMMIILLQGEP